MHRTLYTSLVAHFFTPERKHARKSALKSKRACVLSLSRREREEKKARDRARAQERVFLKRESSESRKPGNFDRKRVYAARAAIQNMRLTNARARSQKKQERGKERKEERSVRAERESKLARVPHSLLNSRERKRAPRELPKKLPHHTLLSTLYNNSRVTGLGSD